MSSIDFSVPVYSDETKDSSVFNMKMVIINDQTVHLFAEPSQMDGAPFAASFNGSLNCLKPSQYKDFGLFVQSFDESSKKSSDAFLLHGILAKNHFCLIFIKYGVFNRVMEFSVVSRDPLAFALSLMTQQIKNLEVTQEEKSEPIEVSNHMVAYEIKSPEVLKTAAVDKQLNVTEVKKPASVEEQLHVSKVMKPAVIDEQLKISVVSKPAAVDKHLNVTEVKKPAAVEEKLIVTEVKKPAAIDEQLKTTDVLKPAAVEEQRDSVEEKKIGAETKEKTSEMTHEPDLIDLGSSPIQINPEKDSTKSKKKTQGVTKTKGKVVEKKVKSKSSKKDGGATDLTADEEPKEVKPKTEVLTGGWSDDEYSSPTKSFNPPIAQAGNGGYRYNSGGYGQNQGGGGGYNQSYNAPSHGGGYGENSRGGYNSSGGGGYHGGSRMPGHSSGAPGGGYNRGPRIGGGGY